MALSTIFVTTDGVLRFRDITMRCALGKSGVTKNKREGDGKTPLGTFPLREIFFRADRVIPPPVSDLNVTAITANMGWCDDPTHPHYNLLIALPFASSHETLWREDHRYDLIIPLGYNDVPPVAGKGSAIFFHLASDDYAKTEGCVAVALQDMKKIIPHIACDTVIVIAEL